MNDDALYEEVAQEIKSQTMVPGVWARAFAEANGALDQARALYIRYRVAQLAEVRNEGLKQQRQENRRAAVQKVEQSINEFLKGCFLFIVILILVGMAIALLANLLK